MRLAPIALLALLSTPAAAVPVTYTFTGTITQLGAQTLAPVALGEQIPISITLDDAYPQTPGTNTYASASASLVLSATFGAENDTGLVQTLTITPGASLQLHTASPQISAGFGLTLAGAEPGVLPTSAIPAALDPAGFGVGTFSVVEAFSAAEFGFGGVIDGLAGGDGAAVPEPGTAGVLAVGLLGMVALRRRAA